MTDSAYENVIMCAELHCIFLSSLFAELYPFAAVSMVLDLYSHINIIAI